MVTTATSSPSIAVLLADVDGTVVTKEKVITPRAIEAVKRMREAGVIFTITSGRPPRGLRMLVEPLGLTMPMAAFNGGVIVLPDLSVLDEQTIPDYLLPAMIETIESHGLDVWLYGATEWYVRSRQAPRVDREASTVQFEPTVVPTFDGLSGIVKVVGVSDDHPRVAACEAVLQRDFGTVVSAARSQPYYLDVTNLTANKGTAIARLSRYLKIPLDQIATIGDQLNDVLMFKPSGLSIAMGNASARSAKPRDVRHDVVCRRGFRQRRRQVHPPACRTRNGRSNESHRPAQSAGSEPLARQHHPRPARRAARSSATSSELSVTGLTSNPTIFEQAIKNSTAYDAAIREKLGGGQVGRGAVLRARARGSDPRGRPVPAHLGPDQRRGRLGVAGGLAAARLRHGQHARRGQGSASRGRRRPNLFIKIPGTTKGLPAIEEAIFAGIPINVTLLFSREQYLAAAEALHARHRATHRRGARARRRFGRLGVHQPLGRRGQGQGARGAAQPARHRHREADLQGRTARCSALRAGSASTTPARGRSACCGPAPAPRIRTPPTCSTSGRWRPRSP